MSSRRINPLRWKWVNFVQFKRADWDAAPQSCPLILCSEHFAECNFIKFMVEYHMRFAQSRICRAVHRVTNLEKIPVRISKDEADEQQAHSVIPKTERYIVTLKQAQKRPWKKEAVHKCLWQRKNRPQIPVAKKERPNHKCWWQTKKWLP